MTTRMLLAGLLALSLAPWVSAADGRGGYLDGVQLLWENDSFLPADEIEDQGVREDAQYTNGVRLTWEWNPERRPVPRWLAGGLARWCRLGVCGEGEPFERWGGALGHSMFTPQRITDRRQNPRDRPYAGHLFLSTVAAAGYTRPSGRPAEHAFDLQVGLVGPSARGKELQTWWHRTSLGSGPEPKGWDNQLRDELTLNLDYRWRERFGNERLDFVPSLGFGLGSVATYGSVGGTVRAGWNLEPLPAWALPPRPPAEGLERKAQVYLVAGAEGRFVAHNLFLHGSLFRSGPELVIDPEPFVYDLKLGAVLAYRCLRAEATWTRRSKEFESPARRLAKEQEFLTVAITWRRAASD